MSRRSTNPQSGFARNRGLDVAIRASFPRFYAAASLISQSRKATPLGYLAGAVIAAKRAVAEPWRALRFVRDDRQNESVASTPHSRGSEIDAKGVPNVSVVMLLMPVTYWSSSTFVT